MATELCQKRPAKKLRLTKMSVENSHLQSDVDYIDDFEITSVVQTFA